MDKDRMDKDRMEDQKGGANKKAGISRADRSARLRSTSSRAALISPDNPVALRQRGQQSGGTHQQQQSGVASTGWRLKQGGGSFQ